MAAMIGQEPLLAAIAALYHHPNPKVKEEANRWLEQWQQTVEAWSTADSVLHDPAASLEAHYFAAQTLRTKVLRDFEELPAAAVPSLRDSLIGLLLQYGSSEGPVRTQLCLAISALAAHVPAKQWSSAGVVSWLWERLSAQPNQQGLPCMLELLVVLPQEAGSYRPAVRPERRRQAYDELTADFPEAINILCICLRGTSSSLHGQVLKAFTTWLKLNPELTGLPDTALAGHPLVVLSLTGLRTADLFDDAVDATAELIYSSGLMMHHAQPPSRYMPLVQELVHTVLQLCPRLAKVAAQLQAEGADAQTDAADDEDTARGMARLFIEAGETYTDMLASGSEDSVRLVTALLQVSAFPDNEICSMSLNFWHRFARFLTDPTGRQPFVDDLYDSSNGTAPQSAVSQAEQTRRITVFVPAFEQLVGLIHGRVRFPNDYDQWHRDERADFKRHRVAIGDTLVDAASVLGGLRVLSQLVEPLQRQSQAVAAGAAFDWRNTEAALYCIRSVHRASPPAGDPLLLALLQSLPSLPHVPQLQYTAALTLAAYADWLADSLQAGHAVHGAEFLQFLTRGLSHEESGPAAALAFKHLCDACKSLLAPFLETMMQLYQRIQPGGDAVGEGASRPEGFAIDEDALQQVVEGIAIVISSLPEEQRRQGLAALLQPLVATAQRALTEPSIACAADGTQRQRQALVTAFDRMTVIFKHVQDQQAIVQALASVWQLLDAALTVHGSDGNVAERLCRLPRYALRSAGAAAAPLLPLLVATLPGRFAASGHSCYLYVASELVKVFGSNPTHEAAVGQMLSGMLGKSCQMLQTLGDFVDSPDVADDSFLLAGRALHYSPRLILHEPLLPALLDAATAGVLVQHKEAGTSILSFLTRLLDPTVFRSIASAPVLLSAFATRAPRLVRLLFAGVAGALPDWRCKEIGEVIYNLLAAMQEQAYGWVAATINALPDVSATYEDKEKACRAMAAAASQSLPSDANSTNVDAARQIDDVIDEISELCRRNRHSYHAAQLALLPVEFASFASSQ